MDKLEYLSIDIPFTNLPVYQLLARKHRLNFCDIELSENRIRFELYGSEKNKILFRRDMNYRELHEDRLGKLFTR